MWYSWGVWFRIWSMSIELGLIPDHCPTLLDITTFSIAGRQNKWHGCSSWEGFTLHMTPLLSMAKAPVVVPIAVKYMSRKLCSIKVDQWYDEHGHATLSFHTFPVNSSAIFCPIFSSVLRHKFTLEQKIAIYTYHPYHCIVHNTWTIFLEARKLFYEFNSCWLTLKMYLDC